MAIQFLEGMFQIANVFLSIVAIFIIIPMLKHYGHPDLRPWKYVLLGLLVFDILLIVGAFRSFGLYENPYLTHLLATVIMLLLIYAQHIQLRGWKGGTP